MAEIETHGLQLVRSDTGDGGWSLHGQHDAPDDSPLLSGEAERIEGEWSRPNQDDYDIAEKRLRER
jgi:hypothetical protein